jgi:predicted nucleic acid-binding protein
VRPYTDTNFFTRLYLPLQESAVVIELVDRAKAEESAPFPLTWLHRVETANAFHLHVFAGKFGQQRITIEQAAAAYASFRHDIADSKFLKSSHVDFEKLESDSVEISLRHTASHGFRVYDILHVCSALQLNCDEFWSFDPKACKLASREGLKVLPAKL